MGPEGKAAAAAATASSSRSQITTSASHRLILFWEAKHRELSPSPALRPSHLSPSSGWPGQEIHIGLSSCPTAAHIYLLTGVVEPTASGEGSQRDVHVCVLQNRDYASVLARASAHKPFLSLSNSPVDHPGSLQSSCSQPSVKPEGRFCAESSFPASLPQWNHLISPQLWLRYQSSTLLSFHPVSFSLLRFPLCPMATALAPLPSYPGVFYLQTFQPAPPEATPAPPSCRQKRHGGSAFPQPPARGAGTRSLLEIQGQPVPSLSHITIVPLTERADALASGEGEPQTQPLQV